MNKYFGNLQVHFLKKLKVIVMYIYLNIHLQFFFKQIAWIIKKYIEEHLYGEPNEKSICL